MIVETEEKEALLQHVEKHLGPVSNIYKELIPGEPELEVFIVAPTAARDYYTLVTSGMSSRPMKTPEGAEEYRYAELMIGLPKHWKLSDQDFRDERNYWPVRELKRIARFPHLYDTWLYYGHTLANEDPSKTYSEDTKLKGMLLWLPEVENKREFFNLELSEDKTVHFYSLIPLYQEELNFKLKHGDDELIGKLTKVGTTEVLDLSRKNACKKILGLF